MEPHRETLLIEMARRGRDGDYVGASAVAALQARADALEARPNITSLDAVPDVDAPSPATGAVLRWNGSAWAPASVTNGIPTVRSGGSTVVAESVTTLDFGVSFNVTEPNSQYVAVVPQFAGSGGAPTFARSDHTHTTSSSAFQTFGPAGYMSSGTRSLASMNVTLAAGVTYQVRAELRLQMRGADPGACYYRMSLTINGNTSTSAGGSGGFWCVQGVPNKETWVHTQTITGTGAAITVSAAVMYHSGGGFYTDAGEIEVELRPNR